MDGQTDLPLAFVGDFADEKCGRGHEAAAMLALLPGTKSALLAGAGDAVCYGMPVASSARALTSASLSP